MLDWINRCVLGVLTPPALMGCGVWLLLYLRGGPMAHPCAVCRVLTRHEHSGGITPFRALTLALAGTLGVGNIVGVASAIAMGGAGAIFWMWVSAAVAMILKYAEVLLAVTHHRTSGSGIPYGGAMYYIRDVLDRRRLPRAGAVLAGIFALLCLLDALSTGCVIQVNAAVKALEGVFDVSPTFCGIV